MQVIATVLNSAALENQEILASPTTATVCH